MNKGEGFLLNPDVFGGAVDKFVGDNAYEIAKLGMKLGPLYLYSKMDKNHRQKMIKNIVTDKINQNGLGLLDGIKTLFSLTQRYPNEKHTPYMTKQGIKTASYMGPQTEVLTRLTSNDSKINEPLGPVDKTAQLHDIMFMLSENNQDVREADERMLKNLNRIERDKSDYKVNILMGKAIKGKIMAENIGLLNKGSFSNKSGKNLTPRDRNILMKNYNRLTQEGYGFSYPALWSNEIDEMLKNIPYYKGCFGKDILDDIKLNKKQKFCCVVNTEKSNKQGKHWCALYYTPKKGVEYMDPYGIPPLKNVVDFCKSNKLKLHYNNVQYQKLGSVRCGYYCVHYIQERHKNRSPYDILYEFSQTPSDKNEEIVV